MAAPTPALVTPEWVADRLQDPNVRILDATWYLPNAGKNPVAEFKQDRIPGSRFFDLDGVATPANNLPHMMPSEAAFAAAMDVLGITNETHVVVYDRSGIFSAPRAWFTFNVMGHSKVSVLEGGYPAWKALSLPVDAAAAADEDIAAPAAAARSPPSAPAKYTAKFDASKVRSLDDMLGNIGSKAEVVVDARPAGRFAGTEPEPRAGLRGGHIPGALNVPFPMVLESGPTGSRFKDADALKQVFAAAGVDLQGDKQVVGSCGSGLTACVLALAAHKATGKLIAVYDGSWMEWGSRQDVPVDTTPAKASA